MELGLGNTLLPGDPRLIDHIVAEVKSQGIFDQFRKECIADVDTKPAYQNLNARVESSVNSFLNKQKWRADLNKNQLRETLRKHIHDAPYLEVGVDRIVDQVVNPKIYSVFMPKIEDVVYKYLGIERPKPQRNGACDLKDLLPTDLDPVSPESDRGSIKDESMEFVGEDGKEVVNREEERASISNAESKPLDETCSPVKREAVESENEKDSEAMDLPAALNTSFRSDDAAKTEEEEEESPDFEPIDVNLNESNMSNDSHLSGISELTSHRSVSPDFATEFARDNFDCSNQDSQLSKVSSNSRLSIVTDVGSSNHGSTPKSDAKEDSKSSKDNLKVVKELDSNKDSKFNFDVAKIKDASKTSSSSKESSRDATDYKDVKPKDECRSKSSKERYERSRGSRRSERDSRRRRLSSKRRHRSRSKDKAESDSQEGKDCYQKLKEIKIDKRDDSCDEITDLKDRYKEKIRELREKIVLTEKGKLGKMNAALSKDKKEGQFSSKDKGEPKKSSHKSSSRSSSHHSKSSRNFESKESRDKSSIRHEQELRRQSEQGKGESKSNSKNRRDSKSGSRSSDRSKNKKRRDEKKTKSTDDHSSLRKNLNDRRSSDRDGSDGSNGKYSHKTSSSISAGKLGPTSELTKDSKEQHSSGETESAHDSLQATTLKGNDGSLRKIDPGSSELSLPLKKRRLPSDEDEEEKEEEEPAQGGSSHKRKRRRSSDKKASKRKLEQLDAFKSDSDVASVPDDERVQIVEYADEEYDQPYPGNQLILSLEETKKIILDAEPVATTAQPSLSEMEQSIRQSLSEMLSDHKKIREADDDDAAAAAAAAAVNAEEPVAQPMRPDLPDSEQSILTELMADRKTDEEAVAAPPQSNLSEMEQSIHRSLSEIMADYKASESDAAVEPVKLSTIMDSSSLLEALTDDSSTDKEAITGANKPLDPNFEEKSEGAPGRRRKESERPEVKAKSAQENREVSECGGRQEANGDKGDLSIENQLEQFEAFDDAPEKSEVCENSLTVEKDKDQSAEITDVQKKVIQAIGEFGGDQSAIVARQTIEMSQDQGDTEMKKFDVTEKERGIEKILEATFDHVADDGLDTDETSERDQARNQGGGKQDDCDDEFNEDDALVIDEDFDESENADAVIQAGTIGENPSGSEEIEKSSGHKIEIIEVKDGMVGVKSNIEDEADNKPAKQVTNQAEPEEDEEEEEEEGRKAARPPSEFTEKVKEEIKNQLINELAKLDENDSDDDKHVPEDEIKESTSDAGIIEVIKLDDSPPATSTKSDSEQDDSDIDIVEIKDDDEVFKLACESTEEKIEEFDPLAEDTLGAEKPDEINVIENIVGRDSAETHNPDEAPAGDDPLAISQQTTDPATPIQKFSNEANCITGDRVDYCSPDEEDCRYFLNDNDKYFKSFKQYLDQLEAAGTAKVAEETIESSVAEESLDLLVAEQPVESSVPLKRKYSPSPIVEENIVKDNNNDGLTTTKELPIAMGLSNQKIPIDEPAVVLVLKKRKVGRMKKSSSSGSVTSSTSQTEQPPQDKEQQTQAPTLNGENFMMPLSPESDISVSSDKNQAGHLRDEKRGQRSSQRYSSDDLYKPRPLFSSSSRRTTRRYHQA